MSLVLSLACPTCALPSSLYLSPWAAPWGAPPPLPGSPLVSCQAFCKEKPLGERRKGQKIINFHWPSGEPRVFARKLWLSVVCGGSRLGVVGTGLKPWAWWAAQGSWLGCGPGLLLKVLDPLPEARRTACLGFCGLSPRGPAPFWQKGRRQAAISKYLVSHRQPARTEAPNQDSKVGHCRRVPQTPCRVAPGIPSSPLVQPVLPLHCGFKPGVSVPLDSDK